MNAYVSVPSGLSRAMDRVADALKKFAPPTVQIVNDIPQADVVFLHVIGFPETWSAVQTLRSRGKKYVILQYCMRSTQEPKLEAWLDIWRGAEAVYSYFDLEAYWKEDGGSGTLKDLDIEFVHAPLGADSKVFAYPGDVARKFTILTSGYLPEWEGVLEAHQAVVNTDGVMIHLGPGDARYSHRVDQILGCTDQVLARRYQQCKYVAGLRRAEGFELPAVEGLLCGARPIVFDRPHYRQWYGNFAEYIPEGDFETTAKAIQDIFEAEYRSVTTEERFAAASLFSWPVFSEMLWHVVAPPVVEVAAPSKPRMLWIGDAVVASGFARATHRICDRMLDDFDIAVLGLNHVGDPHDFKYKVFPCVSDFLGLARTPELAEQADIIVIQNDPWNIPKYLEVLAKHKVFKPVVGVVAVDGKNIQAEGLNGLSHAIFWTKFGEKECRKGGFTGSSSVIGLGVDTEIYRPLNQLQSRRMLNLPGFLEDKFIIGMCSRNQPRKRLDLAISFFAEWVHKYDIEDAYIYMHIAPTGDVGWDLKQLMQYYGFKGDKRRLISANVDPGYGIAEQEMAVTYSSWDLSITATSGEGWDLPRMEAMACGVPNLAPDAAALGEWPNGSIALVPCDEIMVHGNMINTIGAIPNRKEFIEQLHRFYKDKDYRDKYAVAGFNRVNEPQFRWENVAKEYVNVLNMVLDRVKAEAHAVA